MADREMHSFINAWHQEFGETLTLEAAAECIDRLCIAFEQLAEAENLRRQSELSS
ncbi:MAG: hypothetical protein ABL888_03005 [Pirellulaceae bacterium]